MKIEKIIRSKRKTIALQITDSATLIIKAPINVDDNAIMKIVEKHEKWINQKKKEIESRIKFCQKQFVNGEGFLYLGRYYKLKIVDNQDIPLKLILYGNEKGFYLKKDALPQAKEIFIQWYKKAAYEVISERVNWYAQKRNFKYNKVKITDAKKRWGSCSPLGNLNFSWRLIMAPLPVLDYVVVHELVHLEEKNHKEDFWIKVKLLTPDYERHKEWLNKNGHILML